MKDFIKYMDQVKAEEELKEKTKAFIKKVSADNTLQNTVTNRNKPFRKKSFVLKKLLVAASSIAACAIMAVSGYAYYNNPVSYVSFDINPSVELGLNAFDRIVRAEGINPEGQALLLENKLYNTPVDHALEVLVQEAAEQGYFAEDGTTVIALTALADKEEKAVLLQDRSRDKVQQVIRDSDMECIVYADCSNLQLRTQAGELGLSPGKYRLIAILQALDPGITVEQYRNTRVTEIIEKINELLEQAGTERGQLGVYERNRAQITAAAQQIQERNTNLRQGQNMNREQNEVQNQNLNPSDGEQQPKQLQNQEQNQFQEQSQNLNQEQEQSQEQNQEQVQNQGSGSPDMPGSGSINSGGTGGTGGKT
jgi:hypothetical protein